MAQIDKSEDRAIKKQTERITKLRKERRAKLYMIDKEVLFGIFESGIGRPQFAYGIDGIPKDCIVDNVGWDFNYNSIVYRVLHDSFEPLQEGTVPTYQSLNVTVSMIAPPKEPRGGEDGTEFCRLKGYVLPKSPIEAMIDQSTGAEEAHMKEFTKWFREELIAEWQNSKTGAMIIENAKARCLEQSDKKKRLIEKIYYKLGFVEGCSHCAANQYVIKQEMEKVIQPIKPQKTTNNLKEKQDAK